MSSTQSDEGGFTLIEIVVSMLLLSILAMSFLPLVIRTTQISARMTTVATATQILNEEMELARNITTCAGLQASAAEVLPETQDARGVHLQVVRTLSGTCPTSGHAGTLSMTATVNRVTPPAGTLAASTTLVYVATP